MTKMLYKDDSGALPYLMIALFAIVMVVASAAVFRSGWEVLSALLISIGLLFIVQVIPFMRGAAAVVAGLVLVACGIFVWF